MDILKEELSKKRKSLAQQVGGKRIFKRSEIEQKRINEFREEEKREAEQKYLRQNQNLHPNITSGINSSPEIIKSRSDSIEGEEKVDLLNLPRQEVIRRLRLLKQPISLFGEDEEVRLNRLKYVVEAGLFEVDDDMADGQTNDFLKDIVDSKKRQKIRSMCGKNRKPMENRSEDNDGGDGEENDKDLKLIKADFEELCDDDKILVYFKRLLFEWKQEIDEMPDLEKRTAIGKSKVAIFKQCARYLNPVLMFCRKKILPDDIRQSLMLVVNFCMERDYRAAANQYIKLAIGNAAWPIGVTMVGIHERSAREKITNSAHIMNNETTRKYLQSVKRLMTFCQRRYPTVPSKAVEFNSLANGSDLLSLLAEEGYHGISQPC